MSSNKIRQIIELICVARQYEQVECVIMIQELLEMMTDEQVAQMHQQQACKCYPLPNEAPPLPEEFTNLIGKVLVGKD